MILNPSLEREGYKGSNVSYCLLPGWGAKQVTVYVGGDSLSALILRVVRAQCYPKKAVGVASFLSLGVSFDRSKVRHNRLV